MTDIEFDSLDANTLLDSALRATKRRMFLCRNAPKVCCNCRSNQIQLLGGMPALWKCRTCKTKFKFEPLKLASTKEVVVS